MKAIDRRMKKLVVRDLRRVAQNWWDKVDLSENRFETLGPWSCGICWEMAPHRFDLIDQDNLARQRQVYDVFYEEMRIHIRSSSGYLCPEGTRWDQRAMFCLLLAESIEQELRGQL